MNETAHEKGIGLTHVVSAHVSHVRPVTGCDPGRGGFHCLTPSIYRPTVHWLGQRNSCKAMQTVKTRIGFNRGGIFFSSSSNKSKFTKSPEIHLVSQCWVFHYLTKIMSRYAKVQVNISLSLNVSACCIVYLLIILPFPVGPHKKISQYSSTRILCISYFNHLLAHSFISGRLQYTQCLLELNWLNIEFS